VRIHHLNCGSLCPRGGRLFGASGGLLSPAPMCCHCLLIEGDDRLILVDAGLGVEDVNEPRRLGHLFNLAMRPRLEVAETALRQVVDLGYRPSDVRHIVPTHLDLDHAGGICDFPAARGRPGSWPRPSMSCTPARPEDENGPMGDVGLCPCGCGGGPT